MTHSSEPGGPEGDDTHDAVAPVVAVTVVRSGGIAGMTRRWSVHAPASESARWITLVQNCPWDDRGTAPAPAPGADRFTWSVQVRLPEADHGVAHGAEHSVDLNESQASGPWRTLIDAVRAASPDAR